ncbi:single-stranded-DNA-specific exonuclease RecJ [Methyloversatilis sp. XJ19-13]|uniref:single-stranded-DNA-specific exonuclease RecJ n=1 Tax=Methyloversatilis sp. XJ19-13 TaxID=2963430 RepID=UPI00211C894A|nr:single-stranded-DNA-specific exonuclease RecJ [Methyloversatilis sp. XJ19-13]MCQ9374566.1 single-stranded-DNA-specific exonuclease RecJ [Methyloversatilis sp. XJ19-13]
MTCIKHRPVPLRSSEMLAQQGVHPLLARLYAARGVQDRSQIDYSLKALLPPDSMRGLADAAVMLADAIEADARLLIVADYDCDGATACAIGIRALRAMGANVSYLVPNRFEYGYGLTPEIVDLAAHAEPDMLITVDNGIASVEGVARANELGMSVLVTDHHLPGDELPAADVIVNPNQPGCDFPSKAIAGCGVMFYVMLALRAELRSRGAFDGREAPNLGNLLDLVALGTVADVVKLDHNNRILVTQGMQRIRAGNMVPGLRALFAAAGREPSQAQSFDLGFALGPRLNAAGRLSDMSLGIECLITDDFARALGLAQQLDAINRERREIEQGMQEDAEAQLAGIDIGESKSLSLFHPDWHQGVIGIVASRIKERAHRPTIAFARGHEGEIKGSGRSIAGLHLRDALDLVSKREPGLIIRFGGHAMAAGLTLLEHDLDRFRAAFERAVADMVEPSALTRTIETDGALEASLMNLNAATLIEAETWGQGFPPPVFSDRFEVRNQRLLKDKHLKLALVKDGASFDAIWFNRAEPLPARVTAAYRLDINEYQGVRRIQLMVEHAEPV